MLKFKGYRLGENPDTASDSVVLFSVDGVQWAKLPWYLNEVNHSPTGLNWGYYGSGCAQLAYAILRKYCEKFLVIEVARTHYPSFKYDFVAKWGNEWELDAEEITEWFANKPLT